ncbi:leukotriene A-4 hydrolase [Lampetra fluviatilis]
MDPSSLSQEPGLAQRHLSLSLHVDFSSHVLRGVASLRLLALSSASSLVLDTRDLKILKVTSSNGPTTFAVGAAHKTLGSALEITLPTPVEKGQEVTVDVEYETAPSASALQWLTPEQTAGKQHPYLFSQCQAIHCRSMVPCQDTPSLKFTYDAKVSVPKSLVALMSALSDGSEPDPTNGEFTIHKFKQPVQIPSYLIALVVGALESREIGPRSKVWSEKEFVEQAASEFSETETMLTTAEELVGPYVWGRYDLLVLPPSFPYGGMENPCLTFVTPTVLAGDKSLAGVVAHEISHSWTGNLVTNKTWEHFWLNEGHTVYLERMIAGKMFGEKTRQFFAIGGWKSLQESVDTFGPEHGFTKLVPVLDGVDPDDSFSTVPYEKGFALLYHLEQALGGPDVFIGFVKAYIEKFAYSTATTEQWKAFLFEYFKDKADVLQAVDWKAWIYSPGMPPVKLQYDTTLADACSALAARWSQTKDVDLASFNADDLKDFSSNQKVEFLALLLLQPALPVKSLQRMEEVYKLNSVKNSEIRFRWLRLGLRARWEEAIPLALRMATEQGRMKFTRPLFRDLFAYEAAHGRAIAAFQAARATMHPVTGTLVAKDLNLLVPN